MCVLTLGHGRVVCPEGSWKSVVPATGEGEGGRGHYSGPVYFWPGDTWPLGAAAVQAVPAPGGSAAAGDSAPLCSSVLLQVPTHEQGMRCMPLWEDTPRHTSLLGVHEWGWIRLGLWLLTTSFCTHYWQQSVSGSLGTVFVSAQLCFSKFSSFLSRCRETLHSQKPLFFFLTTKIEKDEPIKKLINECNVHASPCIPRLELFYVLAYASSKTSSFWGHRHSDVKIEVESSIGWVQRRGTSTIPPFLHPPHTERSCGRKNNKRRMAGPNKVTATSKLRVAV